MLIISLCGNAFGRGRRIIAEGYVFLIKLESIAAKADVRTVGIKSRVTVDLTIAISTAATALTIILAGLSHLNM